MTGSRAGRVSLFAIVVGLAAASLAGIFAEPTWAVRSSALEVQQDEQGKYFVADQERVAIDQTMPIEKFGEIPPEEADGVVLVDGDGNYSLASATKHLGIWSFIPPLMAIILCLTLKEPLIALLVGVVSGGLLLGKYNITDDVLLPSLASPGGAGILLLYLWLLGALMGIWSRTGAAEAFAQWATDHLVRGPRTAKLVAWILGIFFFQGGTISTVLVGTTVKPVADRERISHEELSYIVDSTASPIAILMAFNAWPLYIQALLYVPGVAYLATEQDRLNFFFQNLPLSFYAWFAVLGTFLLSIDKAPILGKKMRAAIKRSRETGQLDRPGAEPMLSPELQRSQVPEGYKPSAIEFVLPLAVLTAIAVGTFIAYGSPQVRIAFGIAALVAAGSALVRGMSVKHLMDGIGTGLKGVVVASVILLLAVTLGTITKETGAASYLVDLLGNAIPYWTLPGLLFVLTVAIAFSTGTSWGTYAVAFPLSMPLAFSIATADGLADPDRFVAICFAAVLNGSVMGDQCSPVSDTTVLSSMTTGADLMDHVLTQIVPASVAAALAIILWTALAVLAA
jgi:Na+/H+ antiporter NhaC